MSNPFAQFLEFAFFLILALSCDAGDTGRAKEPCAEALEIAEKLGIGKIVEQMTDLKQGLAKKQVKNS